VKLLCIRIARSVLLLGTRYHRSREGLENWNAPRCVKPRATENGKYLDGKCDHWAWSYIRLQWNNPSSNAPSRWSRQLPCLPPFVPDSCFRAFGGEKESSGLISIFCWFWLNPYTFGLYSENVAYPYEKQCSEQSFRIFTPEHVTPRWQCSKNLQDCEPPSRRNESCYRYFSAACC
jgi:hypothetical protein